MKSDSQKFNQLSHLTLGLMKNKLDWFLYPGSLSVKNSIYCYFCLYFTLLKTQDIGNVLRNLFMHICKASHTLVKYKYYCVFTIALRFIAFNAIFSVRFHFDLVLFFFLCIFYHLLF